MPRIPAEVDEPRRTACACPPPPHCSLLGHCPACLALSFPFPPVFLFLSLFSLSFRSFVSYPPTTMAMTMASFAICDRETLPRAAPPTLSRAFPTCDDRTFPSVSVPQNQGSRVLRLIIRRQSAFKITGKSLIKGYVA